MVDFCRINVRRQSSISAIDWTMLCLCENIGHLCRMDFISCLSKLGFPVQLYILVILFLHSLRQQPLHITSLSCLGKFHFSQFHSVCWSLFTPMLRIIIIKGSRIQNVNVLLWTVFLCTFRESSCINVYIFAHVSTMCTESCNQLSLYKMLMCNITTYQYSQYKQLSVYCIG